MLTMFRCGHTTEQAVHAIHRGLAKAEANKAATTDLIYFGPGGAGEEEGLQTYARAFDPMYVADSQTGIH